MAWKPHFERGIALFKQGQHPEALEQFNNALANGGENQFILYDSRAAIYECLNNPKDALRDAKITIKVAPPRWQGYARAARLFMKTHRFDASLKMVEHALAHARPEDRNRREELLKLKQDIMNTQEAITAQKRKTQNHMLKLPVEIYGEIFQLAMVDDYTQIFTLLYVCGYWRHIVWDAPGLWHTLILSKSRADKKAALWLERSRFRIRELHILSDYTSRQLPGRPDFLDDIDWSYLRVCRIQQPDLLKHINPHLMFRELEHLEINTRRGQIDKTFFHPSTKLKSLSVLETTLHLEHFEPPFPSLTSIHLVHCFFMAELPDNFITLLNANPQIESLHLEGLVPKMNYRIPLIRSEIEDLPDLKSLTTLEAISNTWASFILLLNIPMLRALRLVSLTHPALNHHFTYWISTGPKFLTELSLKNMSVNKTILIQLVRTIHTIEVLSLVGMFDTNNVIVNALVEMEGPKQGDGEDSRLPCLCPRLRHLDVSNCPDVETSALHALVKQRLTLSAMEGEGESAPRVSKLEVLKMDGCPKVDATWLPWFRERVPQVSCIYAPKKEKRGVARRM